VSRRWVRCLLARPACESMRCSLFMGLLGHRIAALGSESYARRTDVGHYFRILAARICAAVSRRRFRNNGGEENTSRQPQFPRTMAAAKADLGRANVDTVLHRRRHGQPLDDSARASCRFGPHTMHWVTPGRGRAASKRSRNSCSKSDFFSSSLPPCECR
jgi:hypothetical protein